MTDPETPLQSLHNTFCRLTGRTDRYEPYRYEWSAWAKIYSEQDLIDTLSYVLNVNKSRKRGMEIQTSVRRLICDVQEFERHRADMDQLARARAAKKRQFQPSEGTSQLAAMRHEQVVAPDAPAKRLSLDTVVEALRKAKE